MKKLLLFGALLFWLTGLKAQTNFIHQDSIFTSTSSCTGGVSVCIDSFTYDSINNLRFYLNGQQFSPTITPCYTDTIHDYAYTDIFRGAERGPWLLDSWLVDGRLYKGSFANLSILVDSMRIWDPSGDWRLEPILNIIYGYARGGKQYSCQSIRGTGRGGLNSICYNAGLQFRGLRLTVPTGVKELVIEKTSLGQRDTVKLISACIQPEIVRKTITVGASQNYCVDMSQLIGTPGSVINYCSHTTNNVKFDAPTNGCIRYTAAAAGSDTACLKVCDQYGICDTTILIVTAESNIPTHTTYITDTITIGLTRENYGTVIPTGTISSFQNICPSNSGTNVSFSLDVAAQTVTYKGLTEGVDTVCIKVCNTANLCETTVYYVTALPVVVQPRVTTHTFNDTITIGLAGRSKCSFDAPVGTPVSFKNLCASASGSNVGFTVDTVSKCIRYTGLTVGVDTACIEICNAARLCDTTKVYVQALAAPIVTGRKHIFVDTITVGLTRNKCDFIVPSSAITIKNLCESQSGSNIDFMLNTTGRCVSYMGVTPGADTACIEICNVSGLCDTTYMYVTTLTSQVQKKYFLIDSVTVRVGETKIYCADSSRVGASFFRQFYHNSPLYAAINPTPNACMSIRGGVVGRDTINMILIGSNGIKDTTQLYIIVTPAAVRPTPSVDTVFVKIFETKTYCPDSSELRGSPIRHIAFCSTDPYDNSIVTLDSVRKCVNVRGVSKGIDTFCIVLTNEAGFKDTTKLFVKVSQDTVLPNLKLDSLKLTVGDSIVYCGVDTTEIRGSVDSISNYCQQYSGTNSIVEITTAKCLKIKGLREGIDTACIVVCNKLSKLCDTTKVVIIVQPKIIIKPIKSIDSIVVVVGQSKQYCPDSSELRGAVITNISYCSALNVDNATVTLDTVTKCVKVVGNTEGRDTICLQLCNANNVCDTTTLYIKVNPQDTSAPVSNTEFINLDLGSDTTFCGVDSLQIRGSVDTIFDACPGKNGLHAFMVLDRTSKCVAISGRDIGIDTMCLVVHNKISGLYDTTFIIVNVRDRGGIRVIANEDYDTLRRGMVRSLYLYKNDTLSRQATSLTIVSPPSKGRVDTISFQRGLVTYTASRAPSACGIDSFTYRVCIDTVCDEAIVVINVICSDSLRVYNGISPNGDTKNQAWLIDGLQNYPHNTVCVFNRWGAEVLKAKDYQNDWEGKWGEKDLPDGTYFYWIRNDDNGEVLKTGYLQIMR